MSQKEVKEWVDMQVLKSYSFTKIEEFAKARELTITEYGPFVIGERFMCLNHPKKDICYSFVMDGYSESQGAIYLCAYKFS